MNEAIIVDKIIHKIKKGLDIKAQNLISKYDNNISFSSVRTIYRKIINHGAINCLIYLLCYSMAMA